jgi:hypothetical protein
MSLMRPVPWWQLSTKESQIQEGIQGTRSKVVGASSRRSAGSRRSARRRTPVTSRRSARRRTPVTSRRSTRARRRGARRARRRGPPRRGARRALGVAAARLPHPMVMRRARAARARAPVIDACARGDRSARPRRPAGRMTRTQGPRGPWAVSPRECQERRDPRVRSRCYGAGALSRRDARRVLDVLGA